MVLVGRLRLESGYEGSLEMGGGRWEVVTGVMMGGGWYDVRESMRNIQLCKLLSADHTGGFGSTCAEYFEIYRMISRIIVRRTVRLYDNDLFV